MTGVSWEFAGSAAFLALEAVMGLSVFSGGGADPGRSGADVSRSMILIFTLCEKVEEAEGRINDDGARPGGGDIARLLTTIFSSRAFCSLGPSMFV